MTSAARSTACSPASDVTALTRPYWIEALFERREGWDEAAYPFNLPAVRSLHRLEFHPNVTFLVGENGAGKSTLIEALADRFHSDQDDAHRADPGHPGAWTRAYILASTSPLEEGEASATAGLLAAVGHDPALLEPLRERYRAWIARLEDDGLADVDAHIARLAADGLWAADLFGLAPPDPQLRERILQRLLQLAGRP